MRFKPVTLLAPLLAGLLAACGGGDPLPDTGAASTEAADAVPDQTALAVRPGQAASTADLVLQLRRGASIGPVAARHGLRVLGQFGQRPIYRVQVAAGLSADTVLAAVQQDSDVRFAERNVASQTPEGRRNSVWLIGGDARAYATQWVPPSLNLPAAHGLSTGRGPGRRAPAPASGARPARPAPPGRPRGCRGRSRCRRGCRPRPAWRRRRRSRSPAGCHRCAAPGGWPRRARA